MVKCLKLGQNTVPISSVQYYHWEKRDNCWRLTFELGDRSIWLDYEKVGDLDSFLVSLEKYFKPVLRQNPVPEQKKTGLDVDVW